MSAPTAAATAPAARPRDFAADGEVADCTAIVVTYNSAADLGGLLDSLPAAASGRRVRVVVVDNDSTDAVADVAAARPGVRLVAAGANLGYAGAINVGRRHLGETRAVLVLNPDVRLAPGSVRALLDAAAQPGVGAAVPRFLDGNGALFPSQRREPALARALGDALFGRRCPRWLSEMVWTPHWYERAGPVDWSTGAAVLIPREADAAVGDWDAERFFLYSEETDYLRRIRQAGWTVRYVPDAVVTHSGRGSGGGPELVALAAVNRVRYFGKYHGRLATAAFGAVVALHHLLRARRPADRLALRAVLSRRTRSSLPGEKRSATG
jgi:N-acetylglucosaminyl-diphospho-decaprenol L-rhamnosyltransferase